MEIQDRITEKLTKFCVDNGITCFRTIQHLTIAANLGASAVYEKQAEEDEALIREENREFAKVFEKARRPSHPDSFPASFSPG